MKKYLIQYHTVENKMVYPTSVGDRGKSYMLTENVQDAQKFYGNLKYLPKTIATRIFNDVYCVFEHFIDIDALPEKQREIYWCQKWNVIEIDEEPKWYFEIQYALEKFYGLSDMNIVSDAFCFDRSEYQDKDVRIFQLHLKDLENYYQWVKQNYKPKTKDISKIEKLTNKVNENIEKLKTKYAKGRRIGTWGAKL